MDTSKVMRVGEAAKIVSTPRTTVLAAIGRGEIRSYALACGLPVIRLADAEKWAKNKPRRSRSECRVQK